jgi:hypothetical protein
MSIFGNVEGSKLLKETEITDTGVDEKSDMRIDSYPVIGDHYICQINV